MTPKEHKQRHVELHRSLDELFAHHPNVIMFIETPIIKIMTWSHEQTKKPTELKQ